MSNNRNIDVLHTKRLAAWLTPEVRKWLYGVATAVMPLLVAYGVLESQQAPLWLALVASVAATSTALVHTNDQSNGAGHLAPDDGQ